MELREQRKGRGAVSNEAGRFERFASEALDDGWGGLDEPLPPLKTTVTRDATRTIIARNNSPDIGFDRSINPYRGCEHGCIYCFARPTHAFLGLSPGQDFESRLFAKPDAARLLAEELRAENYRCRVMAMGTNTDPYQPIEREWQVTRQVLQVLHAFRHPVGVVTKSHLIARDIDILSPMAALRLARVGISVTTLDRKLARKMEPRAPTPEKRLETIQRLSEAGIPVTVMAAPVIPGLTDHEIEAIAESAAQAGATDMGYVLLRMPLEIKDLFREWLSAHVPDRAARVINLMRAMRGGKDYDARWGERMTGKGPFAELIAERVRKARARFGLDKKLPALDTRQFRPPPRAGDQLRLL